MGETRREEGLNSGIGWNVCSPTRPVKDTWEMVTDGRSAGRERGSTGVRVRDVIVEEFVVCFRLAKCDRCMGDRE